MNDTPTMQTCACGDGCEDRASVKWRGYLVVECVPDQQAGRLLAAITEGMADAVAEERAAVVAWLRTQRLYCTDSTGAPNAVSATYAHAADAIEDGEHRREEGA